MTCTSSRNTKSSGHGPCGACPMHSRPRSKNSIRYRNSKPLRSSVRFWKSGLHGSSEAAAVAAGWPTCRHRAECRSASSGKRLDQEGTAMACPDCDSPAGDLRFATSIETHGLDCGPYETFNEEFIVCRECGGRYDVCEWDGTQELREIRIPSDRIETTAVRLNQLAAG